MRSVWALLPLLVVPRAADAAEGELSGFRGFAFGAERSAIVEQLASRRIGFDVRGSSIHLDDLIESDKAITILTFKDDRIITASIRFEVIQGAQCGTMRDRFIMVVDNRLAMKYDNPDIREIDDDMLWRIKSDYWIWRFKNKAVIKAYYSTLMPSSEIGEASCQGIVWYYAPADVGEW